MDLRSHILASGGTGTIGCHVLAQVAKRAGCSHRTLYVVSLGHKKPSALLATQISAATGGAVPCEEIRPDLEWHTLADGRKVSSGPKAKPARKRKAA